jgi:ketosteroid isomerase-like protein
MQDAVAENARICREYVEAWIQGDVEKGESFYAEDMIVQIAGRNPLAGTYRGRAEYERSVIDRLMKFSDGKWFILSIEYILASEDRVMALVHERMETPTHGALDFSVIVIYKVKDGKFIEMSVWDVDQYAVDEFYANIP